MSSDLHACFLNARDFTPEEVQEMQLAEKLMIREILTLMTHTVASILAATGHPDVSIGFQGAVNACSDGYNNVIKSMLASKGMAMPPDNMSSIDDEELRKMQSLRDMINDAFAPRGT